MRSAEYWAERFMQLEKAQNKKGQECYQTIIDNYRRCEKSLNNKLSVWYQRFADNNGISFTAAKKLLTSKELDELKWDIDDYIKYGRENAVSGEWMEELENASSKYHISRLEALKLQLQQDVEALCGNNIDQLDKAMRQIYTDGYLHTAFEIQKGTNVGFNFSTLDKRKIDKVIRNPWATDRYNFSQRLWRNKDKLVDEMNKSITRNIALGQDPEKAINEISRSMNVSKSSAARLVMTEEAYFSSVSQHDAFKDLGVKQYEILATLDNRTSKMCRELDGKHFDMSDYWVGVTAPPFHCYCRTTICPYFDDEFTKGEQRAARGENGKTYYVPSNMTYNEWAKKYVSDSNHLPNNYIKSVTKENNKKAPDTKYSKNEAINKLKDDYGIDFKDSRKYPIDQKLLSNSVEWLDNFNSKYSSFMNNIKHKLPLIENVAKSKMNAMGKFSYYINGEPISIKLNGGYFSNFDTMSKYMDEAIKSQFTVANASPHKTFIHEFGHYIAKSIKNMSNNPNFERDFLKECMVEFKKEVPEYKHSSFTHMKEYLSEYGSTSQDEMFAEAFAEAYGGDNPRTFAKIFGEKLDKILKGMK